jgi:hypothetical protein
MRTAKSDLSVLNQHLHRGNMGRRKIPVMTVKAVLLCSLAHSVSGADIDGNCGDIIGGLNFEAMIAISQFY